MSTLHDITVMRNLVKLKYQKQQESFGRLLVQENNLRNSLTQLDNHMSASRNNGDAPQKAIGADVAWQAWIGRKKRELNMQLAQVLALKERHIAQVRKAYGKVLVTDELFDQVSKDAFKKKAQSQLDHAITSMPL